MCCRLSNQAIGVTLVDTRSVSDDSIETIENERSPYGVTPGSLGVDAPRDAMTLPTTKYVTKDAGKAEAIAGSVDFFDRRVTWGTRHSGP
ncbi:MAG: hypothetical protein U0905_19840 [Pirellulales bacterium]